MWPPPHWTCGVQIQSNEALRRCRSRAFPGWHGPGRHLRNIKEMTAALILVPCVAFFPHKPICLPIKAHRNILHPTRSVFFPGGNPKVPKTSTRQWLIYQPTRKHFLLSYANQVSALVVAHVWKPCLLLGLSFVFLLLTETWVHRSHTSSVRAHPIWNRWASLRASQTSPCAGWNSQFFERSYKCSFFILNLYGWLNNF